MPDWKGLSRTALRAAAARRRVRVVLERPFQSGDRLAVRFKDGSPRREGVFGANKACHPGRSEAESRDRRKRGAQASVPDLRASRSSGMKTAFGLMR